MVEIHTFPFLIGTDICRPHGALVALNESGPVRLRTRDCDVCREQRTQSPADPPSAPITACAAFQAVIEPCTAVFIRVRVPNVLGKESNISVKSLSSRLEEYGCAALPSVHAPADSMFFVPIANPSNLRIEILTGSPVAAIASVAITLHSTSTAAVTPQLTRNEKLCKVLRELHVDTLPDLTPHKRALVSLVCKYIDVFAESDADGRTTSLTFHEIDTADIHPLRRFVRRLPYGEVRKAVANEIEKLTKAGIARPSTSPWASPVVMVRKMYGNWPCVLTTAS